jgi:hypothetical protein
VKLATSYYAGFHTSMGVPIRTSVGTPKWWRGELEAVRRLMPPYAALHIEDAAKFERLCVERLDRIDVEDLYERLESLSTRHGGRRLVLLCFERDPAECHRSILARWLTDHGFGPVPEVEGQLELPGPLAPHGGGE